MQPLRRAKQVEQHRGKQAHHRDDGDHQQERDLDAQGGHGTAPSTSTLAAS